MGAIVLLAAFATAGSGCAQESTPIAGGRPTVSLRQPVGASTTASVVAPQGSVVDRPGNPSDAASPGSAPPVAGPGAGVGSGPAPTVPAATSPPGAGQGGPSTTAVAATTSTTTPNLSLTGEPIGPPCVSVEVLTAAFTARFGSTLPLGTGLRALRCEQGWATAWTSPDPADPEQPEPAVVVFRRDAGAWIAVGTGTSGNCIAAGVPEPVAAKLDCY